MAISGISVAERGGGKKGIVRIYAVTILLVVAMILSGCRPGRSGTPFEPSLEDISRIKNVGLHVKVEKGFAVRLQYVTNADDPNLFENLIGLGLIAAVQRSRGISVPREAVAGGAIGGAIGGVIGGVIREFSPDRRATRALKPEAAQMNSADAIGHAMVDKLETAKVFPAIELVQSQSPAAAQESGIDTLFIFTVRRWGLRPPLGSKYDKGDKAEAQLELDVNLKLISSATSKVLWERNEFYPDSKSYSLGDFKSQEGLLAGRMEYVLQMVCDCTANEVYRTPQNQGVMQ